MGRARQAIAFSLCAAWLGWAAAVASGSDWVNFANETASRLIADAGLGVSDTQEKDYIWGDIDQDGEVNIFDIMYVLDAFKGEYAPGMTLEDCDVETCRSAGRVNIHDIMAVLDTFGV